MKDDEVETSTSAKGPAMGRSKVSFAVDKYTGSVVGVYVGLGPASPPDTRYPCEEGVRSLLRKASSRKAAKDRD